MRLHYLQHETFEHPAGIAEWARERGHEMSGTLVYTGAALPALEAFDALVIMGGSMSVNDEARLVWLGHEKRFIAQAIARGKLVLGVCLGGQLIANVLGAAVSQNEFKEIGWFPVHQTAMSRRHRFFRGLPESFTAFHWHGETFAIPPGCDRLAASSGCQNQAFCFGERVLALQFHLETTPDSLGDLSGHCVGEIVPGRYVETAATMASNHVGFQEIARYNRVVLDHWAEA